MFKVQYLQYNIHVVQVQWTTIKTVTRHQHYKQLHKCLKYPNTLRFFHTQRITLKLICILQTRAGH